MTIESPLTDAILIGKAWAYINLSFALKYAEWVLDQDPYHAEAVTLKIKCLLASNKKQAAQTFYRKVTAYLPLETACEIALSISLEDIHPVSAPQHLLAALKATDETTALKHLDAATTLAPDWFLVKYLEAKLRRNLKAAEIAYQTCPNWARSMCITMYCELLREKNNPAGLAFLLSQEHTPETILQQTLWLLNQNNPEAIDYFKHATKNFDQHDKWGSQIKLYEQTKDHHNAHLVWQYLSETTPYWPQPMRQLSYYYYRRQNIPGALEVIRCLITIDDNWDHYLLQAQLSNTTEDYQKLLSRAPADNQMVALSYANHCIEKGHYLEAIDFLQPFIARNPQCEAAVMLLKEAGRLACDFIL